jgi:hypothetical protein
LGVAKGLPLMRLMNSSKFFLIRKIKNNQVIRTHKETYSGIPEDNRMR